MDTLENDAAAELTDYWEHFGRLERISLYVMYLNTTYAKHEVIVPRTDVVVDIETEVVDDTKNSLPFLPSVHFHSCEEKNMFILTILKQRLKD